MTATLEETLERIYDELDGIAGGDIPEDVANLCAEAMLKVGHALEKVGMTDV